MGGERFSGGFSKAAIGEGKNLKAKREIKE